MSNAPIFPPNAQSIRKRLEPYSDFIYEQLNVWTCDQSAQVISGIDPDGFNQRDADNFEALSWALSLCTRADNFKDVRKIDGIFYHDPHEVIQWAIHNGYANKMTRSANDWYEDYMLASI